MARSYPLMPRVSKHHPCPICQHTDWCLCAEDGSAAICPRVEAGSLKRAGRAGHLHILDKKSRGTIACPKTYLIRMRSPELVTMAAQYQQSVNGTRLATFASQLGVTAASLKRLRIGWDSESRMWSLPMCDGHGLVTGIQLRDWHSNKRCVPGSRLGLFLPEDIDFRGSLVITEGASDCAALLDLGFAGLPLRTSNLVTARCVPAGQRRPPVRVPSISPPDF